MNKIIVAIDGFSSCGKSTMAKALAKYAGYVYVDTGAMYRATALYALNNGLMEGERIDDVAFEGLISDIAIDFVAMPDGSQHICLNGVDVEGEIRSLRVANAASCVSTLGCVRTAMVAQQQAMGAKKGIVMDGRDIGTVVFPSAELKVFLTASAEVRAKRRFVELLAKGSEESYECVLENIVERDYRDTHRKVSPLVQADDAMLLDNTWLSREEQMQALIDMFDEAVNG